MTSNREREKEEMSGSRKKDGRAGRKRLVDRGKNAGGQRVRQSGAKRTSAIFSPTHHDTTRIFLALCVHICTQMGGEVYTLAYVPHASVTSIYFTIGCV